MQSAAAIKKAERVIEHRRQARYRVEFPVSFTGDHTGTGIVYNLGLGGCKIMSPVSVTAGSILDLQLQLPDRPPLSVRASTVRWAMEDDFGVDFLGMQETERDRLTAFIEHLSQEI
ncbi:MAG: PilZ domain-containing protein [Nitrospira sp.]